MSPHLQYKIAQARQQEITARSIQAHHAGEMHRTAGPRRPLRQRLPQAVVALSVCLGVATAMTVGGAHADASSMKSGGRVSAQQYAGEIHALEARGYVPAACTIDGTLLRNYGTGGSVIVKL
jgi:hypothetical protein